MERSFTPDRDGALSLSASLDVRCDNRTEHAEGRRAHGEASSPTESSGIARGAWLERAAAWPVYAFAVLLAFPARHTDWPVPGAERSADVPLILGAPLVLWLVWRRRGALSSQLMLVATVALPVFGLLSEVLRAPQQSWPAFVKHGFSAYAVLALGAVCTHEATRRATMVAACLGGALSLVIAIPGYLAACFSGRALGMFALSHAHPTFDGVCRMTGMHGGSPQNWGEYLVALLCFALIVHDQERLYSRYAKGLVVLAAVALVATFSYAWLGGAILLAVRVGRRAATHKARRVAGLTILLLVAVVGASWAMNIGRPASRNAPVRAPCARLDIEHQVVAVDGDLCQRFLASRPYQHWVTPYGLSKATAMAAFAAHPLVGTGHDGWSRFARDYFTQTFGAPEGYFYDAPHSTFLGQISRFGLAGLGGLALFLVAVWRTRPWKQAGTHWPFFGVVAFLVIGLNMNVERQRHFWLLAVVLSATALAASSRATRPGAQASGVPGAPETRC
jgi:hypothetical protein